MTIRYSDALRSFMAKFGSMADGMHNGKLLVYTGSQPVSANAAATGTLLCTFTDNGGAHTAEVLATGTVTLTGGASGSVTSITVNGVEVLGATVAFNATLTQTAADVAAQINRFKSAPNYRASSSGAVVTIKALPGTGASVNTFAVVSTASTITTSDANLSGGVSAVNGLKWGDVAAGVLTKLSTQTWKGTNAATGTAGWFRFVAATADPGTLDSSETYLRADGSVATSGADMNLSSTAFVSGADTTLPTGSFTMPAS